MSAFNSTAGNFVCAECGCRLTAQVVVSNENWARIANGDYALCPTHMDERFAALGDTEVDGTAFFFGKALRTKVPDEVRATMRGWVLPEFLRRTESSDSWQHSRTGSERYLVVALNFSSELGSP